MNQDEDSDDDIGQDGIVNQRANEVLAALQGGQGIRQISSIPQEGQDLIDSLSVIYNEMMTAMEECTTFLRKNRLNKITGAGDESSYILHM